MDPTLRRRIRKMESANKKVGIENRRLAREVIQLNTRLEKLEASLPEAVKLAKAGDKMVARLHGAVVKVVTAIGKLERKVARLKPKARSAKPARASGRRTR